MIHFLCLAFLVTSSWAFLYPPRCSVVELTPSNFDNSVIRGDEIWIVEFFAPWCGYCQNLVPEYTKAANALKGIVKVGAVNADEYKKLGGRYGVRGFPTIKIFGANKSQPEDYQGARTAEGIVNAGLNAVKAKVKAALGGGSRLVRSFTGIFFVFCEWQSIIIIINSFYLELCAWTS